MTVRITHGVNQDNLPLAGLTINAVVKKLCQVFNIPSDAEPFVNGELTHSNHVLVDGDHLELVQPFGSKGGFQDYWSEEDVVEILGSQGFTSMRKAGVTPDTRLVYDKASIVPWITAQLDCEASPLLGDMREVVSANGLEADPATLLATYQEKTVNLTRKQFRLLYLLVKEFRPKRKHDFYVLKLFVWQDSMTTDNTVGKAISRLNDKLTDLGGVKIKPSEKLVELIFE